MARVYSYHNVLYEQLVASHDPVLGLLLLDVLKSTVTNSKERSVLLGHLSLDLGDEGVDLVHFLRYFHRWYLDLSGKSDVLFV